MKPIIWTYWENKNDADHDPAIVQKHKAIFERYDNIKVVNNSTIHQYLGYLVDCGRIEHIAQKVDYYRAKLLYEYGGIWLDMDSILLEDLTDLWETFVVSKCEACCEYGDCGGSGRHDDNIPNANVQVMFFQPKSDIAEQWYKSCEQMIESGVWLDWGSLGGLALGKVIQANPGKTMVLPGWVIWTLGWEQHQTYYSTDSHFIEDQLRNIRENKPKIIMLYGKFMYDLPVLKGCLLEQMWGLAE